MQKLLVCPSPQAPTHQGPSAKNVSPASAIGLSTLLRHSALCGPLRNSCHLLRVQLADTTFLQLRTDIPQGPIAHWRVRPNILNALSKNWHSRLQFMNWCASVVLDCKLMIPRSLRGSNIISIAHGRGRPQWSAGTPSHA